MLTVPKLSTTFPLLFEALHDQNIAALYGLVNLSCSQFERENLTCIQQSAVVYN